MVKVLARTMFKQTTQQSVIFITSFVSAESSAVCVLFLMSPLHPSKTFRIASIYRGYEGCQN